MVSDENEEVHEQRVALLGPWKLMVDNRGSTNLFNRSEDPGELENVILTPHIAGVTSESNVRVSAATARNVRRVLELRT